jgi:diacylglycerol kinase family enzyme
VLVSNNPYQVGDLVGAGRRARMDTGRLGVVAVTVGDARHAVGLLRHTKARGLTIGEAPEVVVTSGADHIPAGIDGESVSLPTPVTLTIQPGALRVRVPRDRPGVPRARPPWSWARLRQLAGVHSGGPR